MHRPITAVLLGLCVVAVLPAAAQAGTAEVRDGKLTYAARNAEVNNVDVRVGATGKLVIADSAPQVAGAGCLLNGSGDLECDAAGVTSIELSLADRNDVVRYRAPQPGTVNAGIGTDTFIGGLRPAPTGAVTYLGGDGLADALRYTEADRGVTATLGTGAADGRPGDLENARSDIEVLEGSRFGDVLTGTDDALGELFVGAGGIDRIDARGGPDRIDEGTEANGADTLDGGSGRDVIDYSGRRSPLNIFLNDIADDGVRGFTPEGDDVRSTVEDVIGGRGDDNINGTPGANDILGGAGRDIIHSFDTRSASHLEGDTVNPGAGRDSVITSDRNDVIFTRDGENDDVGCRGGLDFVTADPLDPDRNNGTVDGTDHVNSCEAVDAPDGGVILGAPRIAPTALRAEAGKPTRMTLGWRHPKSWRKLRAIELRITRDGLPIGAISVHPHADRVSARGAVGRVRGRVTRHGRWVRAHLAIRLDERLAGATLRAAVEAKDGRGVRQVERAAATILVR